MATVTQDDVLSVLKRIAAPDGRGNVVSAGLVSDIAIQGVVGHGVDCGHEGFLEKCLCRQGLAWRPGPKFKRLL